MKAISLDKWGYNGIVYEFNREYEIDEALLNKFPHKFKVTERVTSELKVAIQSEQKKKKKK